MEFLQSNWVWISFIGFFLWMMASAGGCCGSAKHGHGRRDDESHRH